MRQWPSRQHFAVEHQFPPQNFPSNGGVNGLKRRLLAANLHEIVSKPMILCQIRIFLKMGKTQQRRGEDITGYLVKTHKRILQEDYQGQNFANRTLRFKTIALRCCSFMELSARQYSFWEINTTLYIALQCTHIIVGTRSLLYSLQFIAIHYSKLQFMAVYISANKVL